MQHSVYPNEATRILLKTLLTESARQEAQIMARPRSTLKELRAATLARFHENYNVAPNGCWQWRGKLYRNGYGRMRLDRKEERAHRVAYMLHRGTIPHGLEIDHTCHNPEICHETAKCPHRQCVNPAHLEIVTAYENRRRGNAWRWRKGITHCPQGHPYEGANIIYEAGRRRCRVCRKKHWTRMYLQKKAI